MSSRTTTSVAGIWLEFIDDDANTVAQQIVDDWDDRPVPDKGQAVRWEDGGDRCREGVVVARQFDLQHTAEGEPRLWVRLLVRVGRPAFRRRMREFSLN